VATIIKLKRSTVSSTIPTTSDLADGEVAVNIADRKLYIRNGASIVEVANNTAAGSTDLTNVGTNIVPDTDNNFDIGSLTATFRDIFVGRSIKTRVDVFTRSGGLGNVACEFAFKVNSTRKIFDEVFTTSSGLGSKAINIANFNDINPAYEF
jgi:hypothetical protein